MTTRDSLLALSILLVTLAGCAQKSASTEPATPPAASAPAAEQPAAPEPRPPAESTVGPAPRSAAGSGPSIASTPQSADEFTDDPALQDVFFEPSRADVGRNGARAIRSNVRWIIENPSALVLVEGHSDYKGSAEANRAMGERRATAVVSLLLKEGVAETRLWTVSYGSDRPVCPEKTDACAAKNRRVHFRVKKP
ncbi:MAG TPA: OmpA family protein [Methylomirabilota bacterium]|jgi:peptidoglycan-associated lipoprotein